MRRLIVFLVVYHGCFFGVSMLAPWIMDGFGSEMFAFTWYFNIYYHAIAFPIHLMVFYVYSIFSWTRAHTIELRMLTIFLLINFISYYTGGVVLILELFKILEGDSYQVLWLHGIVLLSFVAATWFSWSNEND